MNGKSKQELLNLGYTPYRDVLLNEELLKNHGLEKEEFYNHCVNARFGKNKQNIITPEIIYKNCTYYEQFFNINEFSSRKIPQVRFNSLSLKGDNERGKKRIKEYNDINYPIIRLWFNGDKNEKLKCLVTGEYLEGITEFNESINENRIYNLFQLHHILTISGLSVHKINVDIQPSYLLGKRNLLLPESRAELIDLMNTVCISPNEHDKVHCSSRCSDIKYWIARNAVPWGLQSEENFVYFCNNVNLQLDYNRFIEVQTLEWYEKNKENIDLEKNPQDIQEYLHRFE